jgi:hypothetical protein
MAGSSYKNPDVEFMNATVIRFLDGETLPNS